MMQQLRANSQRANVAAARVVDAVSAMLGSVESVLTGGALQAITTNGTTTTTFAWNVMPSVHPTAICTHGKRYERRLQEMLT